MRFLSNKLLIPCLLLIPAAAAAQSRVDQLGSAAAVSSTDTVPICQSCNSGTALKAGTAVQLQTFVLNSASYPGPSSNGRTFVGGTGSGGTGTSLASLQIWTPDALRLKIVPTNSSSDIDFWAQPANCGSFKVAPEGSSQSPGTVLVVAAPHNCDTGGTVKAFLIIRPSQATTSENVQMTASDGNPIVFESGIQVFGANGLAVQNAGGGSTTIVAQSGGSNALTLPLSTGTVSLVNHISYQPGLLTAVNATAAAFHKFSKTAVVDNMEGSAATFTCTGNPTISMYECGTSATCAAPTTIGTVTVTAAGTVVDGTVSNPTITAGDYVAFAMTAGTCASLDIAATAQTHSN